MKADRLFYSAAAVVFLLVMLIGFQPFYTHGTHFDGSPIDRGIFLLVLVHGVSIAAWFVLFFAQSLLIAVRNRKLHMTLGWASIAIGLAIASTGTMVAIRSVQLTPSFVFFNMEYPRFLLVMFAEMTHVHSFHYSGYRDAQEAEDSSVNDAADGTDDSAGCDRSHANARSDFWA